MRQIRDAGQQFAKLVVNGLDGFIQRRDALLQPADVLLALRGIHSLLAQLCDLRTGRISLSLQLFRFGNGAPALSIQFAEIVQIERSAARSQAGCYLVEIRAEEC